MVPQHVPDVLHTFQLRHHCMLNIRHRHSIPVASLQTEISNQNATAMLLPVWLHYTRFLTPRRRTHFTLSELVSLLDMVRPIMLRTVGITEIL